MIKALNAHPVSGDVADVEVFKTIIQEVRKGHKVLLFPEGGRSLNGELMEIKPGVGLLMSKTQAPIIPVYVHGAFEAWGAKRRFPKLWGRTYCVFGKPIKWEQFQDMDKKVAHGQIAEEVKKSLQTLRDWMTQKIALRPR